MDTMTPPASPNPTTPQSAWTTPQPRQSVNGKRLAAIVGIVVLVIVVLVAIVTTLVLSFKVAHLNDRVSTVTQQRNEAQAAHRAAADDAKKAHADADANQRDADNLQTGLNTETLRRGKCATAAEHFEALASFFVGLAGAPSSDGSAYTNEAYNALKACQNGTAATS